MFDADVIITFRKVESVLFRPDTGPEDTGPAPTDPDELLLAADLGSRR